MVERHDRVGICWKCGSERDSRPLRESSAAAIGQPERQGIIGAGANGRNRLDRIAIGDSAIEGRRILYRCDITCQNATACFAKRQALALNPSLDRAVDPGCCIGDWCQASKTHDWTVKLAIVALPAPIPKRCRTRRRCPSV